jgi:sporulation protein YlmC with PRC-barrel domain
MKTRSISCAAAVVALCGLAAAQQAPPPSAEAPPAKAPAVKPSEAPAALPGRDLVGLNVFSSDGTRVGEVRTVNAGPSGAVTLHVKTGGFLGFGGRIVAIPEGRFTRTGQSIRLDLNSEQVNDLPEVKD